MWTESSRAWRDPLDQQYERIEPSQPGERERYVPVSIVEDCVKQIDKIVWQLDPGDLEKSFDINDHEVRITARTGPADKPPQTSNDPIRKLNLATLTATTSKICFDDFRRNDFMVFRTPRHGIHSFRVIDWFHEGLDCPHCLFWHFGIIAMILVHITIYLNFILIMSCLAGNDVESWLGLQRQT